MEGNGACENQSSVAKMEMHQIIEYGGVHRRSLWESLPIRVLRNLRGRVSP